MSAQEYKPYYNPARADARLEHLGLPFKISVLRRPNEMYRRYAGLHGGTELLELPKSVDSPALAAKIFKSWLERRFPENDGFSVKRFRGFMKSKRQALAPRSEKKHESIKKNKSTKVPASQRPVKKCKVKKRKNDIGNDILYPYLRRCARADVDGRPRPCPPEKIMSFLREAGQGDILTWVSRHHVYDEEKNKRVRHIEEQTKRRNVVVITRKKRVVPILECSRPQI